MLLMVRTLLSRLSFIDQRAHSFIEIYVFSLPTNPKWNIFCLFDWDSCELKWRLPSHVELIHWRKTYHAFYKLTFSMIITLNWTYCRLCDDEIFNVKSFYNVNQSYSSNNKQYLNIILTTKIIFFLKCIDNDNYFF
jgi:hypothetical protein